LARALPNAELALRSHGDHSILFADPDVFAERYLGFLTKREITEWRQPPREMESRRLPEKETE